MLDKVSSDRLKLLRFPLIVGVVFIHAYATQTVQDGVAIGAASASGFSQFVRDLVSQGLARVAVPLFFMMSGYFFFLGFQWSFDEYKKKLRSRVNTLLIPFLFWNILTLVLLAVAQWLPATKGFFSGNSAPIRSFGFYDYFDAIFGISHTPISYQFWFIRDLMIMVLLVPLLLIALKIMPRVFLCIFTLLWLLEIWPIAVPSSDAFLFFYLGAFVAFSDYNPFGVDKYGKILLLVYGIALLVDVFTKQYAFSGYIHRVAILFGVAAALYITKWVIRSRTITAFLFWAAACSFFVFAMHEPTLTVIKKVSFGFLKPESEIIILILYFLIPIITIAICILAYYILKKIFPKFLSIISGGR